MGAFLVMLMAVLEREEGGMRPRVSGRRGRERENDFFIFITCSFFLPAFSVPFYKNSFHFFFSTTKVATLRAGSE